VATAVADLQGNRKKIRGKSAAMGLTVSDPTSTLAREFAN
jgi:hypothetical protein